MHSRNLAQKTLQIASARRCIEIFYNYITDVGNQSHLMGILFPFQPF